MGRGDGEKWGRGGRREAPQTLPSADPQPPPPRLPRRCHGHHCARGQRQQCPHLSPGTFLGIPRFTFASRGAAAPLGRASPVGGGSVPWHQTGGSPQGWWPSRRRVAPCVGGVLSPLMGGGERQRLQCHSPSTALPPFWVTSGRGHRSVTPKGGWGGAHPKIEPPSHSQREPPSPPRPLHSAEFPPLRGGTIWGWGT